MTRNASALTNRFEGRLFSDEGRLCLVLGVDTDAGIARISCRIDGQQQVVEMPISEVGLRLATSSNLALDNLGTPKTSNRVEQRNDGWFFTTREGPRGPYPSEGEATAALNDHILYTQGNGSNGGKRQVVTPLN